MPNAKTSMFLKPSLPLAPVSGFVAFDGGGTMPSPAPVRAPAIARAPRVEPALPVPVAPALDVGMPQSATWQPASGDRVRRVEGAVLIAICGYFAFGIGRVFGWI